MKTQRGEKYLGCQDPILFREEATEREGGFGGGTADCIAHSYLSPVLVKTSRGSQEFSGGPPPPKQGKYGEERTYHQEGITCIIFIKVALPPPFKKKGVRDQEKRRCDRRGLAFHL